MKYTNQIPPFLWTAPQAKRGFLVSFSGPGFRLPETQSQLMPTTEGLTLQDTVQRSLEQPKERHNNSLSPFLVSTASRVNRCQSGETVSQFAAGRSHSAWALRVFDKAVNGSSL